jgi:aminoglycoside phosphotransferase (APT) family kinase protein
MGVSAPSEPDLAPLLDVLRRTWSSGDVRLVGARPVSAGASRQTWSLDVVADDGQVVPLVLQRERPGSPGSNAVDVEAQLLRAAHDGGVPVPRLVASDSSGDVLGAPYLLTGRVDGETLPRRILRSPELAAARERFAADCGRILASIHALPLAAVPQLPRRDELLTLVGHLDDALDPSPAFELALRWLREHRPPPSAPVVVHGDFRNGNLIVGPDGVRAVLDWELAHAGDPVEDLGWLCVRAWRFGEPLPVGGMGTREALLEAYAAAGGRAVDPDVAFWWEVLGTLKWGLICSMQARAHLDGHSRSVELAVIGRRVCENEYDLLRMLP